MIIAITGTPGTGKTEVARELARLLGYKRVDINEFAIRNCSLTFDRKRKSRIIDIRSLRAKSSSFRGDLVLDSHLSHYCKAGVYVVLRARPDVLKRRLEKKGWKERKVKENVGAEILGIVSFEARDRNKRVFEVDTTGKTPAQSAREIERLINKKEAKDKTGKIDWLGKYGHMVM